MADTTISINKENINHTLTHLKNIAVKLEGLSVPSEEESGNQGYSYETIAGIRDGLEDVRKAEIKLVYSTIELIENVKKEFEETDEQINY